MAKKHLNVYTAGSPEASESDWIQSVHEEFEGTGYKSAAKKIRDERAAGVPTGHTVYLKVTVEEEGKDKPLFEEIEPVEGTQE